MTDKEKQRAIARKVNERWDAVYRAIAALESGEDFRLRPGEREQAIANLKAEGATMIKETLDAHPELFRKFADGTYALRERLIRTGHPEG
jgi:hypothetical protein